MSTWDLIERFEGDPLDATLWIPDYLPHWTTPDRSGARYRFTDRGLELLIEHDQHEWRPEDGDFRVSHLQTGEFAGPLGSPVGQHRVGRDLRVVTERTMRRLWAPPRAGAVEVVASASADPTCMLGIWLVGHESTGPDDSGEICVAEVFGDKVTAASSVIRAGIKAHHDPRLVTDLRDVALAMDATEPHTYGAAWDSEGVRVSVDGVDVYGTDQVLSYPLQLMLDLWEFPHGRRDPADYPKSAVIREVRLRTDD
ncbi:glycoside hydrolase family 16 protein [Demequina rhizosphaerae]|uniref:glycoside hydrolase family 16 protein n=1 Tax=Demequina rhizosphaerae TaxID=1638985 RepID=UPI000780B596|nr:glycoside hydrolase family 16 protein [Demequina rhizosphaerae]